MLDFSLYLLYRAGVALASALPMRVLFALGSFAGAGAHLFLSHYRQLARRNLDIAFGNEKTSQELRRITRRHFQRLGANLICSAKMGSMPAERLAQHLSTENFDVVHDQLRKGTPVVLLLSHIGAWETFAQLFPLYVDYVRLATVYQKLGNDYIDSDIRRKRGRTGVEMFNRADGFHGPIGLLRSGGLIGILADQHAGDHGIWTPFFGRLASTSPLPGLLAKRTGAAVIAAAVYTVRPGHWRMVFTQRVDSPADSADALTFKANTTIEHQVRRAPEDWFWVHNRWKTPKPNFLLTNYKRGLYVPPETGDLKQFRILVRGSNWLGDSVMSIPAVRALKQGRPDAHVTIAAPAKIADLWKLVPEVDEIISLTGPSLRNAVRLIRGKPGFDVAVLFPNSLRVALEAWFGGIPRRVGYKGHCRRWFLNQLVPEPRRYGPPTHQYLRYVQIAQELGGSSETALSKANDRPRTNGQTVRIGLCPGAEYGPAKRWFPERFASVATTIASRQPVEWMLFGTAADTEIGATIERSIGTNCVNLIGQTTLHELIIELSRCALLLTNDTGTMHLATLLGVPVVALFGSTEPRLTGPIAGENRVIRHQVECSPCFLRECPIDFRCMKAIAVPEVAQAVLSFLDRHENSVVFPPPQVQG
jgi:lipopolysaccharide heptosyltransferase II